MKDQKGLVKVLTPKREHEEGIIASHMRDMLVAVGEDPQREGLLRTPGRFERALKFLTSGYEADLQKIVNNAIFTEADCDEMVIVKDIEFFSMCEHHLLPFFGKMHVAYLPNGKVIGLSKIPRIVDVFAQAPPVAGAAHHAGGPHHPGDSRRPRRGSHRRSPPFLHDDARRGKAAFGHRHQRHAGVVPRAQGYPRRIPVPGPHEEPAPLTLHRIFRNVLQPG